MKCNNCKKQTPPNLNFCTNCGTRVDNISNKKTVKKFFSFTDNGLEEKWWHRLVKILIYTSTIIVCFYFIGFLYENIDGQINPNPKYVYSFSSDYKKKFGFVEKCTFAPENNKDNISIECGYINKESYKESYSALIVFVDNYMEHSGTGINFWTRKCANFNIFTRDNEMGSIGVGLPKYCPLELNYDLLNEKIEQGLFDNVTVKRVILIYPLLRNILLIFIAPIVWFLFMKLVFYKTLIYIIYGNK